MTDPAQIAASHSRNAERMRSYLLEELRSDLRYGGDNSGDLIAVLCDLPPEVAWRQHDQVANPVPDAWYLWRSVIAPEDRIHADRVIVEDGQIISKWGCGISFYTECAPLELPAEVAAILAENDARETPNDR